MEKEEKRTIARISKVQTCSLKMGDDDEF